MAGSKVEAACIVVLENCDFHTRNCVVLPATIRHSYHHIHNAESLFVQGVSGVCLVLANLEHDFEERMLHHIYFPKMTETTALLQNCSTETFLTGKPCSHQRQTQHAQSKQ